MEICILSMQKVNNYGSLLQAYSLKNIIENLGHDVYFIDIEPNEAENSLLKCNGNISYSSEIERTLKLNKYILNKFVLKLKEKGLYRKFKLFREKYLSITGNENNRQYSLCIIGSDEVFNCLQRASWGFTTQLLGNVRQATRVITYAACCGSTTYDKLPKCIRLEVRTALKNISSISVRDDNTSAFVEKLIGVKPYVHLDPVAVGEFSEEIKRNDDIVKKVSKRYCIVYLYQNRIKDERTIRYIKNFFKEQGITIYAIGETQKWIPNHLFVNPFEALALFSKAEFILTDTFHGTLFGAKYSNKMAILIRESNRNKLEDLVKRLNLHNHVMKTISDIKNIFELQLNRNEIDSILMEERKRTMQYLMDNIGKL